MQNHPSIVQNIGGDQNRVVGGNIIHGDAHIHLHGDTHQHQPPAGQERVESSSFLDPRVEDMLVSLKMTRDDLEIVGIKKIEHRIAIMEGVQRRYESAITGIYISTNY